jgi:AcrR family transcriptional regulator
MAVKLGRGRRPQARKLRDAKDALYREHIMGVAEKIFAEQGFQNTRMSDIAAAAGISLGTLYQSYEGKHELHRAVLIARDTQMFNLVMSKAQTGLLPLKCVEQILVLMESHIGFMIDNPSYLRMQVQEGHAWYALAAHPTKDEQQMWERGVGFIGQVYEWGVKQGFFSPANAEYQAVSMIAMQQTRLANWVMSGMKESKAKVIARIQADYVRLYCRPHIIARMLTEDGSDLTTATFGKIAELNRQASV